MHAIRKATVWVVLAAIGLPACLGVALHWGQSDCCGGERVSSCGGNCPFEHDESVDRIVSLDKCLICEFLAIAKQSGAVESPAITMDRLPERCCGQVIAPFTNGDFLSLLARGPPTALSI
jgi:hypothetical protein